MKSLWGGRKTLLQSDATIFIEIFPENFVKVDRLLRELAFHRVSDPLVDRRHDYIYMKAKRRGR